MCRLAGYVGPPAPLSSLLLDPPRSLQVQAYNPLEMRSGTVNVDGTGIAWWDGDDPRPLRYRTVHPPWVDENLRRLAPRLRSGVQLAAVRSATPGIPHGATFVHPFMHSGLAGTHNGWIRGFRERLARPLLQRLPDHLLGAFDGMSDSLAIFLLAVAERERNPAGGLAGAVRAAIAAVTEECARAGTTAMLNVALADASGIAVAKTGYEQVGASLYALRDGARWPGASVVASEPLDSDSGWVPVPECHIALLSEDGIDIAKM
ncbi:MAG: class II glutamine amidotransferase [Egibacteraceae bacterium]